MLYPTGLTPKHSCNPNSFFPKSNPRFPPPSLLSISNDCLSSHQRDPLLFLVFFFSRIISCTASGRIIIIGTIGYVNKSLTLSNYFPKSLFSPSPLFSWHCCIQGTKRLQSNCGFFDFLLNRKSCFAKSLIITHKSAYNQISPRNFFFCNETVFSF